MRLKLHGWFSLAQSRPPMELRLEGVQRLTLTLNVSIAATSLFDRRYLCLVTFLANQEFSGAFSPSCISARFIVRPLVEFCMNHFKHRVSVTMSLLLLLTPLFFLSLFLVFFEGWPLRRPSTFFCRQDQRVRSPNGLPATEPVTPLLLINALISLFQTHLGISQHKGGGQLCQRRRCLGRRHGPPDSAVMASL